MPTDPLLPDECQRGASFAVTYGMDNPRNAVWQVRVIVDGLACCRKRQGDRWRYECFGPGFFRVNEANIEWRG